MEHLHPRDYFWIDSTRCDEVGLYLQGPVVFSSPQPKGDVVSVPGRNGDLYFFDGSYTNTEGTARCFALMPDRVDLALSAISGWCLGSPGYHRLSVSGEPDIYRLARIVSGPQTEIRVRRLAPFELSFSCKPQKFLRGGEDPLLYTVAGMLYNRFAFAAEPLIKINGKGPGAVQIGGYVVDILALDGYLMLDSQTQNAYKGTLNKNKDVKASEFPRLVPGENEITWTGGVSSVEITPRWWTL